MNFFVFPGGFGFGCCSREALSRLFVRETFLVQLGCCVYIKGDKYGILWTRVALFVNHVFK